MKIELQHLATTASDRLSESLVKTSRSASSWTVLVRLFLGLGWTRAAVAKVISSDWWNGADVESLIRDHESDTILWFRPVTWLADNISVATAVIVLGLELSIAVAFLTARRMPLAIAIGVFLNLNFILVGQPNPAIFYLIMQVSLGLWIVENHASAEAGLRAASYAVGVLALIGIACLPFIKTLHPGSVIEDPGAVIACAAFCTSAAYLVAKSRRAAEVDADMVIVLD